MGLPDFKQSHIKRSQKMARVTLLLLSLMMMEAQSKPTQMELPEMKEIGNIDDVVQTVSRLARSFEGPQDGSSINVRIPRQIGGPPLGPQDHTDMVMRSRMTLEMISTSKRQVMEGWLLVNIRFCFLMQGSKL